MASVLIIDDEAYMRELIRELLEHEGYEVSEAANGDDGLRKIRNNQFDLVIIDIFMPEKDGLETITELRKEFLGLKIMAISGGGSFGLDRYLEFAGDIGADFTLAKPFKRKNFLAAIKKLING
ncbi:MAG: response regulator [bacterium]|nr:response regulator [bacterium]